MPIQRNRALPEVQVASWVAGRPKRVESRTSGTDLGVFYENFHIYSIFTDVSHPPARFDIVD
ncbi:hypothetical protein BH23PLA1_BH23PLA1_08300 [soil metagenome]